MDEPLLGEIRSIAINYAPKGWAFCSGQLLPINQNQALFSLLGTTYGGNGITTFGLPNLMGRVPVGAGQLAGGASYPLGQPAGSDSVSLLQSQMPSHTHTITGTMATSASGDDLSPVGGYPAGGGRAIYASGPKNTTLGPANSIMGTTTQQGGNQPHDNHQPYLATYFVIALQGVFPSRS